jgi:branched-chain amino acid transport system permease protein
MSGTPKRISSRLLSRLFLVLVLVLTGAAPVYLSAYTVISLSNILMYIILTVSWAIFSGPTKYVSLASAAFFGIGMYVSAVVGGGLPFIAIIALGGLLSSLLALLVGLSSLRMRGMYFTIFTFGLSELIRHSVLWWEVNITGTVGRLVVSVGYTTVYYTLLGIVLITLALAYSIRASKYGLALSAIGESESAGDHIGIPVNPIKIFVFSISTFFMGATGATMAARWTYIDPSIAFSPLFSFMPVLMAIFGGVRHIPGQIVGAVTLTLLADMLLTKFPYYYNLLYGIILVGVILYLPFGLIGLGQRLFRRQTNV